VKLRLERIPSPIGGIILVSDGDMLHALDFDDYEARMLQLLTRYHGACQLVPSRLTSPIATALQAYFDGDMSALASIALSPAGTPFQRAVWTALRDIPSGTTTSYGAIARRIGHPGASRAVGLANGANPIAIVVPCHRVIGANAALTGYGGGLSRKAWLIGHEARHTMCCGKPPDRLI
jgi:methylated-DNA-[protein]-cysteine S-methyltransferase